MPEENKTYYEKCSVENCEICESEGFLSEVENDSINSCNINASKIEIPERIDIIKNGFLTDGVIEIKGDHIQNTQLNDSIRYYVEEQCDCSYSSDWWKGWTENVM